VFGEVRVPNEPELAAKFGVTDTPVIMALTEPYAYKGERYESAEIKIDQLRKFLSTYAYREVKKEKTMEMHQLTYASNKAPTTGVCGQKTSNLCLILFLKVKGSEQQYASLLARFKTDPVTIAYVYSEEEPALVLQFGIEANYGAVVYRPKRGKFMRMSSE